MYGAMEKTMLLWKQQAQGPHCSPEKPVQINLRKQKDDQLSYDPLLDQIIIATSYI